MTTQHYVLHYTRQGNRAVPALDADRNGIPDFIDAAAQSWEQVWNREVVQLGYPAPRSARPRRSVKFHVYLQRLRLLRRTPIPRTSARRHRTRYLSAPRRLDRGRERLRRLPAERRGRDRQETIRTGALQGDPGARVHARLQFNINVYQSGWLMESHATWAEDAVYDGINDWHWYINRFFLSTPDLPIFNRYVYGSAYFRTS